MTEFYELPFCSLWGGFLIQLFIPRPQKLQSISQHYSALHWLYSMWSCLSGNPLRSTYIRHLLYDQGKEIAQEEAFFKFPNRSSITLLLLSTN